MSITDKHRADYQWSYEEKLEHLIKVSGEWLNKSKQLVIDLREKVLKGMDTPEEWKEFNEAKDNAELYFKELQEAFFYKN